MTRVACLHTAESNIAIFNAALRGAGLSDVDLRHYVRADLLAASERAGGLTPEIALAAAEALNAASEGADAVLMTCSTLGPAAESTAATAAIPMLRVDAALAREAVKHGGKVAVLCAAATTVEPTKLLFEREARLTGAEIFVSLVPGAWDLFKAGEVASYLQIIAKAADDARRDGATEVALAQSSMAGAAGLISEGTRPLTSPSIGLIAAVSAARSQQELRA